MSNDRAITGVNRGAPPWKPGQSGNPSGRPRLPDWLKAHTDDLLRMQVQAALEGVVVYPGEAGEEPKREPIAPKERLQAVEKLLDRLLGRAPQSIEIADESTNALIAALMTRATQKTDP